ncbi:MAG: hypothetical protein ACRCZ1_06680 [Cetobacterium sp.]
MHVMKSSNPNGRYIKKLVIEESLSSGESTVYIMILTDNIEEAMVWIGKKIAETVLEKLKKDDWTKSYSFKRLRVERTTIIAEKWHFRDDV